MKTILLLLIAISSITNAEIYRWTDKDGKTHFSDNKPKGEAEDITAAVRKQNIDTSTQEHQKLEAVFRKENAADREFQQQQTQPSAENLEQCNNAKRYLNNIDRRVQFVDNKGKMVHVSEDERKARVAETRSFIQKNCKN
ncbi:MAG: DUF4124 domain-containing protein [Pseudomonadota bacterium]